MRFACLPRYVGMVCRCGVVCAHLLGELPPAPRSHPVKDRIRTARTARENRAGWPRVRLVFPPIHPGAVAFSDGRRYPRRYAARPPFYIVDEDTHAHWGAS